MAQPPEDVVQYLKKNFITSIKNDFSPIIKNRKGGFFAVPRLVFCTVEFLGNFYVQSNDKKKDWRQRHRNGVKTKVYEPSNSLKAKSFIKEVLGKVDQGYDVQHKVLYEMFRHGTVHSYAPEYYKDSRKKTSLRWLIYKGKRTHTIKKLDRKRKNIKVRHLDVIKDPINDDVNDDRYFLALSVNCLYLDLLKGIRILIEILEKSKTRKIEAQRVYNKFRKPIKVSEWWV